MKKALLTIVAAASMTSYIMAVTPVDMTVSIPSATDNKVDVLDAFNLKFWVNEQPAIGMNDMFTIDMEKRVEVRGSNGSVEAVPLYNVPRSSVSFRLPSPITIPGTYNILVPEGIVSYTVDGEIFTNKACSTTIDIKGSQVTMTQNEWMQYFIIDPANNSRLKSLGSFTLAGNSRLKQEIAMDAELTAPDGKKYYSAPDFLQDETQAQYRFSAPSDVEGNYTLVIPEGTLATTLTGQSGTVLNPRLEFHYTLGEAQLDIEPVDVDIEASELNTTLSAESFSKFYIKITDGGDVIGPFDIDHSLVSDIVVASGYTAVAPSSVESVDASTIVLTFNTPISYGGDYSVTLPQGLLKWERFTNVELVLKDAFTCTGEVLDFFSNIEWSTGSTWSTRVPVPENHIVSSVNAINAYFPNIPSDSRLTVPMSGSDDYAIGTSKAYITLPTGERLERIISPVVYDKNALKVNINMDSSAGYKYEGIYTIVIPAGSVFVNGMANPEFRLELEVKDLKTYTPTDFTLVTLPSNLFPVEKLSYISWNINLYDEGAEKWVYSAVGVKPLVNATVTPVGGTPFEVPIEANTFTSVYEAGFAIDLDPDIEEPGEYVVTVPEGAFRVERISDGALLCNTEFSQTFKIENNTPQKPEVSPVVTPAPGEVAAIGSFEFFRPTGYTIYIPDNVKPFVLTLPDGSKEDIIPTSNPNVEGDYIFANLPESHSTPGAYTLTIPAGGIDIFNAAQQQISYPGETFTYTVKSYTPAELGVTATPADGSTIYSFPYVYVKFNEPVSYTYGVKAVLTDPEGTSVPVTTSFNKANNRLLVTFGYSSNDMYGEYVFIIPQGIVVTEDGRVNKEIKIKYNYLERKVEEIPFIVTPKEGVVADFQRVTLQAPEDFVSIGRQDHDNTRVEFKIDKRGDETSERTYVKMGATDNQVYMELKAPLEVTNESEKYDISLTLPEGIFTLYKSNGEEVLNVTTRLNWRLDKDGIIEILGENGLFNIYTLDGKCLHSNADATVLETLPKGIYVINGNTVIIR